MTIITNAGKTFLAKMTTNPNLISLGLNENGIIRRYEKGELIAEFKNIDEYTTWVKKYHPEEVNVKE